MRTARRHALAVVAMALALGLGACVTIPYGSPPRQSRLEKLVRGQSTAPDVLLLLGEPRGAGAHRWSASLEPRKLWYYEYQVIGSGRTDLKILLVFFHEDRYDGYLWFSSANLVATE